MLSPKYSILDLEAFLQKTNKFTTETCIYTDEDTGECALTKPEDEVYINEIIELGEVFSSSEQKLMVCDMPMGQCHSNVIEIFNDPDEFKEGDRVFTGYAIQNLGGYLGEWFPHSWIVSADGAIVETFSNGMQYYVGFELKDFQLDDFLETFSV